MDEIVREKLEGFSPAPPPHLWNNIQGQLAAQKRKTRVVYYRWIAAAAVILLAFVAGWQLNEKSEKIQPALVHNQPTRTENRNTETGSKTTEEKKEKEEAQTPFNLYTQNKPEQNIETTFIEKENSETNDFGGEKAERTDMKMMEKILAFFTVEPPAVHLEKTKTPVVGEEEYTPFDKALIAENIKNISNSEEKETGWKLGVQVAPGYSSQVTSHSESYSQNMTYSAPDGNSNVGAGLAVQYKTGKKWSIESGVYYAQNGQKSNNSADLFSFGSSEKDFFNTPVEVSYSNSLQGQMAMNSIAGVIEFSETPVGAELVANLDNAAGYKNALLTEGEFSQVFDFIEIPLYARYNLIDSKIGLQIMGGLNAGIVVGNNAYMENQYGLQNVGKTQEISTLNLSGTVGVGLSYAIGNRLSLAVEPRLNYYLNSINQNPEVEFRPYRIGIFTGLYYEF